MKFNFKLLFKNPLKLIIIAVFGLVIIFLFARYFAIKKPVVYVNDFKKEKKTISNLYPDGRANDPEMDLKTGEKYQRITSEPVYFDVFLPKLFNKKLKRRQFSKIKISLFYQNKNQNIIEIGLRKNYQDTDWKFEFLPLENKLIDEFEGNKIFDKGLMLLQKGNDFKTIDEFLQNLPLDKKIATFYYDLDYDYLIPDYQPFQKNFEFNYPLSGSYAFLFYKGREEATFDIEIERSNGAPESLNLQIVNPQDEMIVSQTWQDGKEINPQKKEFKINLKDQKAGLYQLKIDATNDFTVRKINTSQQYFVAQNILNLAKTDGEIRLFVSSPEISFQAKSPDGFQKIKVNDDLVPVYNLLERKVWPEKNIQIKKDLVSISVPKGEVTIVADGFFAPNEENYFNPQKVFPIKYYNSADDFDYLIAANYSPPYQSKRFYQSSTTFSLSNMIGKTDYLNFIISIPGLYKNKGDVVIYKIKAELIR
jgi:hypothetical protein